MGKKKKKTFCESSVESSQSHPCSLHKIFVTPFPSGLWLNRGENFRMKCICSRAVGGRCLWFANQDGDFWTTITVWQRQPQGCQRSKPRALSVLQSQCVVTPTLQEMAHQGAVGVGLYTSVHTLDHMHCSVDKTSGYTEAKYAESEKLHTHLWIHTH